MMHMDKIFYGWTLASAPYVVTSSALDNGNKNVNNDVI